MSRREILLDNPFFFESMDVNEDPNLPNGHSATEPQQNQAPSTNALGTLGDKFCPYDAENIPEISSGLPPEIWTIVQSAPASFSPQYFIDSSRNIIENPNLTVSFVARAEIPYSSHTDATFNPNAKTPEDLAGIIKHLSLEYRPRLVQGGVEGYELQWTVVRKLIPRNPKVDNPLMQTCHLFKSDEDIHVMNKTGQRETCKVERYLVMYLPHVSSQEEIPFYHPKVQRLAILYTYLSNHDPSSSSPTSRGTLSIYYSLFPSYALDTRLLRTALKLLEIIHRHSRGRQAGYKKRVHHDQIVEQKRFQDTYVYLKGKYARTLIDGWVEQTPAEKHVFEDLGIAAFLMELWIDMYGPKTEPEEQCVASSSQVNGTKDEENKVNEKRKQAQKNFPGFVDIGCGNGLLVYLLNAEGWHGWGFDARKRKTWDTFPSSYLDNNLKELLLVPRILQATSNSIEEDPNTIANAPPSHDGVFEPRTFIISNHADELTPWTPVLAYLSDSPFIAIPCCSHDFGGTRFRAPVHAKYVVADPNEQNKQGEKNKKSPSAYASLCSWVSHVTEAAGHVVEKEFLRIPSTRNMAILGRQWEKKDEHKGDFETRLQFARELVEKEMGGLTTCEQLWRAWMHRGGTLLKQSNGGH